MSSPRWAAVALGLACALSLAPAARAADNKRLLLVTHSGGFVHNSIYVAEETLKAIGPKNGFDVTCFRFTGDPAAKVKGKDGKETSETALEAYSKAFRKETGKTVEAEHCGRINAETLKNFDIVLFFTTGNPVTKSELADLTAWVKAGGAFAGTHCATDTLYNESAYGDLIGAYFQTHPAIQTIKLKVEDPQHPAAKGLEQGLPFNDEIYIFRDKPYDRSKLHIIISAEGFEPKDKGKPVRADLDYAVSWCKEYGKGKVFYTSLGHRREVWKDPVYQQHLLGGLKWAVGEAKGDSTPSKSK